MSKTKGECVLSETDSIAGMSASTRMPRRLRRRMSEAKVTAFSTVEEIEAKLRDAHLRRKEFYENLARRARPKPISSSQSLSREEDLGQRLEAKLQAAEQKRLSMRAQAQMRLAKVDELRQAAKNGLEMRFKKKQAELRTKVNLRVQQAEANRMLILKAHMQRRSTLKERTSQSLTHRMVRENKYKERVRAAIHQKRLAAEKKRFGLLEEEKSRARAMMLQVQKVAKYVSNQREFERKNLKNKLEDKVQRAKRQREGYLCQKSRQPVDFDIVQEQADDLSRKVARCWRQFVRLNKSTLALANVYDALNLENVKSMPFEQLALLVESPANLQTVKSLLDRFETRFKLLKLVSATTSTSSWDDIDHLLKRVASQAKRASLMKSNKTRAPIRRRSTRDAAKGPQKLSRYQARVVLCAYMILGHPDAVLRGNGEQEISLAKSAENFIQEFELLIRIVLDGAIKSSIDKNDPLLSKRGTFRFQLAAFDAAWCSYLNSFVIWKVKDSESLEEDLVRAACQLELSMIQTCKLSPDGGNASLTHAMKAIQKQVTEDQRLLRVKVHHLSGEAGIQRLESALSDTRIKYFQAKENESPVDSPPVAHLFSPIPPSSPPYPLVADLNEKESNEMPSPLIHSLFQDDVSSLSKEVAVSAFRSSSGRTTQTSAEKLVLENEMIVNEYIHEQHHSFAASVSVTAENRGTKSKVKEMMEKAFWDIIINSMKQKDPKYDQVVELMREVRDEITEVAPQSWKEEIFEAIDLDIIGQLLNSGKLDMDYFGKILEFALITLQKLSSPASEDELKVMHQNLLNELAEICRAGDRSNHSCGVALVKGLRFVLEQIQTLKQDISHARIKIVEPLLRGPAGLDYVRNAFANRYGSPSDASTALPLTLSWLSSVWGKKDQEWLEHTNALSELASSGCTSSSQMVFPSTLRTGGSTPASRISGINNNATKYTEFEDKHSECKGEKVDLSVRLGVLKLVNEVSGLTEEALPETLKLNLVRLKGVQAELQKTVVICTSILVLRQTLLSEQIGQNSLDMESILSSCSNQLSELFDLVGDVGLKEITEVLGMFFKFDKPIESTKFESLMNVMARMLSRSLQAGDSVFVRVSRALNLSMRGILLGGTQGRELAVVALRQVAALGLLDRVVEAARVLVLVSSVSCGVHGEWYAHLVERM